ncbi:uncharacterized protein LOC123921448 [Trifolium pratense]|uniref:uncharacterized protein LOC123908209 n=1 Tax=Trifolium pratense TaxID=57577 RepID=UPI001E696A8D|nr:uncharacterized protein LOC123908209 [Trifolium pratense]XP_045829952.1 uncharacterized protein LOC123921448 [Trifolium pratense]
MCLLCYLIPYITSKMETMSDGVDYVNPNKALKNFIELQKISKLFDLYDLKEDCFAYVLACYVGVEEGVDTWFCDDSKTKAKRHRLIFNVSDHSDELTFVMFDDVVQSFAPQTCKILSSMNESSSSYPVELDDLFGDPMIFKVKKTDYCDACGFLTIEVVDVFRDPTLIHLYANPEHPIFLGNEDDFNVLTESSASIPRGSKRKLAQFDDEAPKGENDKSVKCLREN